MLKRLLLAGGIVAVFGGAASAADIAVPPGPSGYAPVVVPTPYYDWTGIYLGANVGAAWAAVSGSATTGTLIPFPVATIAGSQASWGIGGGGQVGFNWFFVPNFMVGAEADIDALSNNGSVSLADGSTQTDKTQYVSTARLRLGLTADRFLWYVTAGFAWAQDQFARTQVTGTVGGAGPGTVETVTHNSTGYAVGTGLEYAFASHWTTRVEFLLVQVGGESYTFPIAGRVTTTGSETIGQVRFGVSYKFGGGDPVPPISARD